MSRRTATAVGNAMNERAFAGVVEDAADKLLHFPLETPAPPKAKPRRKRHWIVWALLALVLAAACVTAWITSTSTAGVRYTIAPVTRGPVVRSVRATGSVNPELTVIVGTYVSGVIQELFCDYNTQVRKGQVCARIDPRPYQTVVDQAKANLAVAQAQQQKDKALLAYAKLRYERAELLIQTNATSQDAVDLAKSNYDQAQAQIAFNEGTIQQRQAVLDAALVNLDYTNITSPVDGVVVSRNVTVGQTVAASFQTPTLFLIATDLTKMMINTNVSESDIGNINIGNNGTFTVDAFPGRTFQGTVTQVRQSPQTVQNVVTYDVLISADNSDLTLKPGMTAAVGVVLDQRADVVRIPNQALRYMPNAGLSSSTWRRHILPTEGPAAADTATQATVWVHRNGEALPVTVQLGLENDSFAEIVGGDLKPGDQVITGEQSAAGRRTVMPRLRF
jgi:HlyD family secretion protein